jgi:hypothetical protein
MTQEHPSIPSRELVQEWLNTPRHTHAPKDGTFVVQKCHSLSNSEVMALAEQAARWGADQELEACCEWFSKNYAIPSNQLRAARRPKSMSLKEQALEALKHAEEGWRPVPADCEIIRRALKQLDD